MGHFRVNFFLTDQSAISLLVKIEYLPRAVVWIMHIFSCLAYYWMIKDDWKVTWHDPTNRVKDEWKITRHDPTNRVKDKWKVTRHDPTNRVKDEWKVTIHDPTNRVKDEWKVTWHDPTNRMMLVYHQNKMYKKDTTNI